MPHYYSFDPSKLRISHTISKAQERQTGLEIQQILYGTNPFGSRKFRIKNFRYSDKNW